MRVLGVRLSAMGDVVHTLGAVRALALARPEIELTYVTQAENVPLFERQPFPIELVVHDRRGGIGAYLRTGRVLRERRFDVALDLQGNWKSAGLAWLSRARQRIGLASASRREPASARLLTRRIVDESAIHPARAALACVRALAPQARDLRPELVATAAEIETAQGELAAVGVDATAAFDVFVVGDPADCRSWWPGAMQRQAAMSERPVLWLAGPAERGVRLPAGVASIRHGPGSLRALIGIGALCARVGGRVLGPDLGATHVLAASGADCTVLFGPQDPARTAPGSATVAVRPDGPRCVPCRARTCRHADGPVCMDFVVE